VSDQIVRLLLLAAYVLGVASTTVSFAVKVYAFILVSP
jgi:hypothetical protein